MDLDPEPPEGVHVDDAYESSAYHRSPDVAPHACNHLTNID